MCEKPSDFSGKGLLRIQLKDSAVLSQDEAPVPEEHALLSVVR